MTTKMSRVGLIALVVVALIALAAYAAACGDSGATTTTASTSTPSSTAGSTNETTITQGGKSLDDYRAAVGAMKRSDAAVSDRDYKLALNYALDARERAQAAGRAAAATRAKLAGEAGRALAELQAAVTEATERLKAAESARPRRRDLADTKRQLTAAATRLQEAREAEARGDYQAAIDQATPGIPAVRLVIARIQAPPAPPPTRMKR